LQEPGLADSYEPHGDRQFDMHKAQALTRDVSFLMACRATLKTAMRGGAVMHWLRATSLRLCLQPVAAFVQARCMLGDDESVICAKHKVLILEKLSSVGRRG